MKSLVLVESPTKAKSLSRFLGPAFRVEATMGHIRDLPKGKFGIDIHHDFAPQYVIPRDKRKRVNAIKKIAQDYSQLYLATDPDREGEAIAWHLQQVLGDRLEVKGAKSANKKEAKGFRRVVFHEITPQAVKEAFRQPGEINLKLVHAQQARRILDRIVGYRLSPLLWVKVKRGLSAGRVQSVALRLIVEREREIEKFKPREYWTIEALLKKGQETGGKGQEFTAFLVEKDGRKVSIRNKKEADVVLAELEGRTYIVKGIRQKEVKKYPQPPFITSTLQQQASSQLYFSAKKTMAIAQNLYEEGLITYHRTDSVHLADSAIKVAREFIGRNFGQDFLPPLAKKYRSVSRVAQEAHEAIRPTDIQVTSDKLQVASQDHRKLYDLIWRRFIACQMREAILDQKTVDIEATGGSSQAVSYLFRATGTTVRFEGWMKIYGGIKDNGEGRKKEESSLAPAPLGKATAEDIGGREEKILPELEVGQKLTLIQLQSLQHFTQAPPRYTEGSLVKTLEHYGIGRPSTYAPVISTIQERGYVEKIERSFYPTELGLAVNDYLVGNFPDIVDVAFTAQMEEELDEIARGEADWVPVIRDFYQPFEENLAKVAKESSKVEVVVEVSDEKCQKCGRTMVVRFGKFGKFLACSGFPECKNTKPLVEKIDLPCPKDGGTIVVRRTKKGRHFYGCSNWPKCDFASWVKPGQPAEQADD